MQYPTRLRVITPEGAKFFQSPAEIWSWIKQQLQARPSGESRPRPGRRKSQHRWSTIPNVPITPSPKEKHHVGQSVVEAVALMSSSGSGQSSALWGLGEKGSDLDHNSSISETPSIVPPVVTPRSADELI
ncbi:hypothetical protein NDU88_008557 [Pleurodeles waltl]|uniref:Uncharacterized protein n=1 Tax=Pleurodeles waltl TaxID=8319 RepID=A0AAV7RTF5_PLEWA|nr:hypothetical protein NDU88_008557 [Pleurodeles waltl]